MAEDERGSGSKAPETIIVPKKQTNDGLSERRQGVIYETADTLPPPPPAPKSPDKK